MIFSKHNSVLVFLMGQNPKCPGYIRREPRRQVKIYIQRVFLPPPSPVLANIYSVLAYDIPRTEDVGLPTKFRFNVGPASQPIAGSMPVNRLRRWPNTNPSLGLLYLRRWPDIETALGDCTVFSDCCIVMRVTFSIPAQETPNNTIHRPIADLMMGHHMRRWANIIPTKTLDALMTIFNRECIFF